MYIDIDDYLDTHDDMNEDEFERYVWSAERKVEQACTTVDGFNKLRCAFPVNEFDIDAVKRCICEVVFVMTELAKAQKRVDEANGYVKRDDGTVVAKVAKSINSGSESISFGDATALSIYDKVLLDKEAQERLYMDTIRENLTGIPDKNGVNLLFTGVYPKGRYV